MNIFSRLKIAFFLAAIVLSGACQRSVYYEKMVVFDEGATLEEKLFKAAHVVPTPQQLAWQELEYTAFIHFGINTFVGREWGDGTESPEKFNPTELDVMQWVQTFKDAGMKMVILTAKHHDGFCLWPTQTTAHSVKASPWRGGQGDLVREVKEACDALGLKFGVYLSPWDRNAESYGDSPRYNEFFRQQLTELLTWYGKVDQVWFDGAFSEGLDGRRQVYDWQSYYELIYRLQPHAVTAIMGEDVRWVGTETGYGRATEWSVTAFAPGGRPEMVAINERLGLDAMSPDLGSRDLIEKADKVFWYPAEVNVSIRPGWFYHAREDNRVKSLAHLVDIYFNSIGMNALLLVNVPPDKRGLIHETDVARLLEFRQWMDAAFAENLLQGARPSSRKARAAIDKKNNNYFTIKDFPETVEFVLNEPQKFDVVELKEHIAKGQSVESFMVEAMIDGNWKEIANGTTFGYKRKIRFAPVVSDQIRITINQARHHALISGIGMYLTPEILTDPVITRNKQGLVTISSENEFPVITFTTDGSDPNPQSTLYQGPFPLAEGGVVKARAFINDFEVSGSIITEAFDISPAKWTVVEASQGHQVFPADYAIDGNKGTMWHTPWDGNVKAHPHQITVNLGEEILLKGFTYAPRTDGSFSGTVLSFSFFVSSDGINWQPLIVNGSFDNMVNNPSPQVVMFRQPVKAGYFRFVSHQGIFNESWVSVGELGVVTR